MSWMRLLAVGKSIIGIRDERSPFKMTQDNLLPKFGLAKSAEPKPATAAEAAGVESLEQGVVDRAARLIGAVGSPTGPAARAAEINSASVGPEIAPLASCSPRRAGRTLKALTGPRPWHDPASAGAP